MNFLRKIHPILSDNDYKKECIEIRPVSRLNSVYFNSLNLWRLDITALDYCHRFFESTFGQPICTYFSAYTFDYDKDTYNIEGKKRIKGQINNDNALSTAILPMDFDDISEEEFKKHIKKLIDVGIETINVFTGHGYQAFILLDQYNSNPGLYKFFTELIISRGFPVDPHLTDKARMLRMPYTFNSKDPKNPIFTKIVSDTNKRFNADYIMERISAIEYSNSCNLYAVQAPKLRLNGNNYSGKYKDLPHVTKTIIGKNKQQLDIYKCAGSEYSMLDYISLPAAIRKMLTCTPEGYRNSVMLFLVPFFKNKLGLSKEKVIQVMQVWGYNCTPQLAPDFVQSEVRRIWNYNYKGFGAYNKDLAQKFGYIDFEEFKLNNKVIIPNSLFFKYPVIHETAVRIYVLIKVYEKLKGKKQWTIEEIAECAGVSLSTAKRYINNLLDNKLIYRRKQDKKEGSYKYYFKSTYDKSKGFTYFNTSLIDNIYFNSRSALTNSEAKLYIFIYSMLHNNTNKTLYSSQQYLAKRIGKSQNRISELTDSLVKKYYLKKDTYVEDYIRHCTYELQY